MTDTSADVADMQGSSSITQNEFTKSYQLTTRQTFNFSIHINCKDISNIR